MQEGDETLLDRTMVLYGSNFGDANAHTAQHADAPRRRRLPARPAPGLRQQPNYPLPNLFVSMLQRMGIEADRFASSTGTMRGLEFA